MKYVTAFLGARDCYSVPVALNRAGMLARHISDFYLPWPLAAALRQLRSRASSRAAVDLPFNKVKVKWATALGQLRLKKSTQSRDPYFEVDKLLSDAASQEARRLDTAGLFLHSGNAYWAFAENPEKRRILFQYHTHPVHVHKVLAADIECHPEAEWSYSNEFDSQDPSDLPIERTDEWKLADKIVVASSFTGATLISQGCTPSSITIAPYGIAQSLPSLRSTRPKKCTFLFVGQGVQRKGLHHLAKAWRLANLKNAELIIISRRIDPGIRSLLESCRGVVLVPGTDASGLARAYSESTSFVMPSLAEGFGLVFLEALTHGLFCIGTENTGLPDLPIGSNHRKIVPAGDIESLVRTLVEVDAMHRTGLIDHQAIQMRAKLMTWDAHFAAISHAALPQ